MVNISAHSAIDVDGLFEVWGQVGDPVENSRYVRDYCIVVGCGQPIRVPRTMIGKPNSCQECQSRYRGKPGMSTYEKFNTLQFIYEQILDGEET